MELSENKCKNCGADLNLSLAAGGVITCEYCNSVFTLPKERATPSTLLFLRNGEANLDTRRFDDAYTMFEKAAQESPDEPEAYFGMALATAQVQYLKDFRADGKTRAKSTDFRMQPICYEVSGKKFSEDKNYLKAISLCTPQQRAAYTEKAEEIDKIRREFCELKKSGLSYDCFICVKVSAEDGKGHTEDALLATKIYHELKKAGYFPFFSEEEMQDRSGAEYEALILYALYSADCMLVVCTDENYLQSPWVKNEYTRYMKMLVEADKQRESITIAFQNTPIEKLPGLSGKIQGINLGSFDGLSRVMKFVDKFASGKDKIPEIKRRNYDNRVIGKKETLKQQIEKRKIEIIKGGSVNVSDNQKLDNALIFMQRSDFARAMRFCLEVIKDNPATGKAYWLLFLAENGFTDENAFMDSGKPVKNYDNLEKAISTAESAKVRNGYYNALYERTKRQKDILTYNEYVALPEADEGRIAELTDIMYQRAVDEKDGDIFDSIIKTVTDADKYIQMTLGFARVTTGGPACEYYRNVLKIDVGNREALYECFLADNVTGKCGLFDYCADTQNHAKLENGLFGYGFNDYAMEKLMSACIDGLDKSADSALKLFDFLLSMIPQKNDKLFGEYLNKFIGKLFERQNYDSIQKYNNLLLSLDELDDNAYLNRVLLSHKTNNLLSLIKCADKLLDDENYISAFNAYAAKSSSIKCKNCGAKLDLNTAIDGAIKCPYCHNKFTVAKQANIYMQISDVLNDLRTALDNTEIIDFVTAEIKITDKKEILTCKDRVMDAVAQRAEYYYGEFLRMCCVKDEEELYTLGKDVTMSQNLKTAYLYAAAANNTDLTNLIDRINNIQPQKAKANARLRRLKKCCIWIPVCNLLLAIGYVVLVFTTVFDNNVGIPDWARSVHIAFSTLLCFVTVPFLGFLFGALSKNFENRYKDKTGSVVKMITLNGILSCLLCGFILFYGIIYALSPKDLLVYNAKDIKYISEKGTKIATIFDRDYYKTYDGTVMASYIYISGFAGVFLVGTDPDAVEYYTSYDYVSFHCDGSTVYQGTTYYYSGNFNFMEGKFDRFPKREMYYCESGSIEEAALELLQIGDLSRLSENI